jgi:hypothetical protein
MGLPPPDRASGVKTPRGRHLRDEVKEAIRTLTEVGLPPAQIAMAIPGLTPRQVTNFLYHDSGRQDEAEARRAQHLTGNSNATAQDYRRIMEQQRKSRGSAA